MSEHEQIARLEADLRAKEQEVERLRSLILSSGSGPITFPPHSVPNPDIEEQLRRAEAELNEARESYEEALNA